MWSLTHESSTPRAREVRLLNAEDLLEVEPLFQSVPNFLEEGTTLASIVEAPDAVAFLVDKIGILVVNGILPGKYGVAHITFWDRVLEGREQLCREVAQFVMACAGLQFLLTTIPQNRQRLLEFARSVGFVPVEFTESLVVLALMREGEGYGTRSSDS